MNAYRDPDQLDILRDCDVSFVVTTTSPGGRITETVKTWSEEAAEARQQADASTAAAAPPPANADDTSADADARAEPGWDIGGPAFGGNDYIDDHHHCERCSFACLLENPANAPLVLHEGGR